MACADCKGQSDLLDASFEPWRTIFAASATSTTAGHIMGIDSEREIEGSLQIGPTSTGMVRLFVEGGGVEIPLDFNPEEAEEIAEEIRAAANRARAVTEPANPKKSKKKRG